MSEEELLYNDIYEKTKDCGRIQFVKLLQQKEIENKKLRESLKATGKGLNKILSKRKKWKDRYYEGKKTTKLWKENLIKYLEHKIRIFENRVMEHGFDDDLIRLNTYQDILERLKSDKYE